ncbi:hypothetical protein CKO31_16080 [Thiohalocapsa halophila]|uniref:DUF3298 domain-containing protein n=1 Tax=Thiohalocapsa halophila TaxID=69359 RepID=A0ABS1CL89_9GAMM|nr:DUF4163 domain-containing protein [Thiohalocapsa halophila]MBK1632229.1 hypothetical protein [Thiohalocapsa halophila]
MSTIATARRTQASILCRGAAAALLALAAASVGAASFDCTQASTRVEKLICADAELSRLDSKLGAVYEDARQNTRDPKALLAAQRGWLAQRNRCDDSDCLAERYRQRIAALGGDAGEDSAGDAMGEPRTERTAKAVRITQQGARFEIDVAYPRLGDGAAAAAGERALAELVGTEIDDFREMYRQLLAAGAGHQGPPWQLTIDYDHLYAAPRFWAVGLRSYFYTGGAHGGMQHLPVVLRRDTGARVPVAGLFRSEKDWLPRVADYSYRALAGREPFSADDDWLREGTAPTTENYRKLLPLADGLLVIFEQYQVGPYAIGVHEVIVPYAELDGLLDPALFPGGQP